MNINHNTLIKKFVQINKIKKAKPTAYAKAHRNKSMDLWDSKFNIETSVAAECGESLTNLAMEILQNVLVWK